MTEEIIINGVDVSGCEKQGETIAGITCGNGERIRLANEIITKHKLCKDNPNCVYKQLKRKEQECEELKKIINETKNSKLDLKSFLVGEAIQNEYEQQLDQLKQTIAEIKEIAEPYEMTINKICGNCKKYNSNYGTCNKNINRYKPTSSKTVACEEFTYLDELVPNIIAINILQKISECEVEND